jgi:cobalt/nickel transport system permease protein
MHNLLDDYAHTNALRDVSSRIKLLIGFGSILLCIFSSSIIAPLLIAMTMSFVTIHLAKIPLRLYTKLLFVPLTFVLFSSVAILFVSGSGDTISVHAYGFVFGVEKESANLALLLLSRTIGGTSSLFFIALTIPMIEIFSILKSFGLPDFLLELSMLIYRYIFVFMDQAKIINDAQDIRLGHCNLKSSFNSISMLSSVLFIRALEQGERLILAMDSRCYNGKLDVLDIKESITQKNALAVFFYIAAAAAVAYLTRDVRVF